MTRKEKILDIIQDTDKNYDPYYDVIPELIKKFNFKSFLEIGIFCGGSIKKVLNTNIVDVYGIDPYTNYKPGMPRMDDQEDWTLLYDLVMERLDDPRYLHFRMTSDEFFERVTYENYIDIAFIDGLHTSEQLKSDLVNVDKIVRTGGVIACHDYNHPTFPTLTNVIDQFVKDHNADLVICPLHLVYMIKTW